MNVMTDTKRENVLSGDTISDASASGVAWPAIIGGAFAAASLSLILLFLGSALGLSSISPWSHADSETLSSFTIKTAIWLIIMQWVASGIGGYLTGRLRTKWTAMHTDEVFFRDTAHGFLAWAVATVLTAGLLASAGSSVMSGSAHNTAIVAAGAASQPASQHSGNNPADPTGYYIDGLFRSTTPNTNAVTQDTRMETARILVTGMRNGNVSDTDKAYLAQLVSTHTGLSQADAARRVDDAITQLNAAKDKAKQEAEEARKTLMTVSLFMFFSLLIGAFIASSAAALGGIHRDQY